MCGVVIEAAAVALAATVTEVTAEAATEETTTVLLVLLSPTFRPKHQFRSFPPINGVDWK